MWLLWLAVVIVVCVCGAWGTHECVPAPVLVWVSEDNSGSWFSSFTFMWVPEIELKVVGLAWPSSSQFYPLSHPVSLEAVSLIHTKFHHLLNMINSLCYFWGSLFIHVAKI